MMLNELLIEEVEREAVATRKSLERVPEGKNDWKPHTKSMSLGNLANLCAGIFGWVELVLNQDELDIAPKDGPKHAPSPWKSRNELLRQLDAGVAKAKMALRNASDDRLLKTRWKLLDGGHEMSNQTRYEAIRDGVLNHSAHHRGQLTVYLRLNEAKVPSIYGPSGDEMAG
jgi:uncharacterized damage-inducible protein DinB